MHDHDSATMFCAALNGIGIVPLLAQMTSHPAMTVQNTERKPSGDDAAGMQTDHAIHIACQRTSATKTAAIDDCRESFRWRTIPKPGPPALSMEYESIRETTKRIRRTER
jgi:hypothetical protein